MRDITTPPSKELLVKFESEHGELVNIDNEYYLAEDLARIDARSSIWFPAPTHNNHLMWKLRKRYLEQKVKDAESAIANYKDRLLHAASATGAKPNGRQSRIMKSMRQELQAARVKLNEFMAPYRQHESEMREAQYQAQMQTNDAVDAVKKL